MIHAPGISIHAVVDGETHPLDTGERMRRWFRMPEPEAEYLVSRLGETWEFDGVPGCAPTTPSELVSKALDRIPGNAPRGNRADWSLLDDMVRGQCAWLAIALSVRIGGAIVVCGADEGARPDLHPDLAWFMHAGVLKDGRVHCALGRMDPKAWTSYVTRSSRTARFEEVSAERLRRRQVHPLSPAVAATLPDVADLIAELAFPDKAFPDA